MRKILKNSFIFTVIFVVLFSCVFLWAQESQPTMEKQSLQAVNVSATQEKDVKSIEIVGNKTISIATILSKIKTRVGQKYIQEVISDDLKRLYNTGYFSDVRVDRKEMDGGFKVIIYVDEKPIVEEVTFSKTRYYHAKVLKKKIKTEAGKFLDNKILKDDENTIKELYAKKGLTKVEVQVESFVDEVTNKASLHFVIREGYQMRVKKINILGNSAYKDGRLLKVMKTRYKWLFNSGYLKEDVLQEDMDRVTSFYEQQGYIDAKANYRVESLYQGWVEVYVQIEEGKRYYVGNIVLSGNKIVSNKEILGSMKDIQTGNVFSRKKLSDDISNIRTLYFDKGYIFANVTDSSSLNPKTGEVELKLNVFEGGLAYIERIKIQGNTRTRDTVVRRELKLYPGDRFDGSKLRRTKEKLTDLGYFEDISFDIEDTNTPDRKDLVIQVKEAKTGTFSFGGGFSTVDQVIGFVEVEQKNFDFTNWPTFTGGGQRLALRAETGSTRNNLLLSFTEPWWFDYPVSFGFDAYRKQRTRERNIGYAYDELRIGGVLRLGKQLNEYLSAGVSYRNESVKISNMEDDVSNDLKEELGKNNLSVLGFNVERNTLDSNISPTKGLVLGSLLDVAGGPVGGDRDFYRLQGYSNYYVPLRFNTVMSFSLKAGIADAYNNSEKVPIFERFFAGGARTIRGYDERKVGPLDPVNNDPIGGESMIVGSVEYTIPLIDFIKMALFYDVGNVWAKSSKIGTGGLKSGTGLGVRIKTPIGPMNLDYGYPLNKEPGEEGKSGKFYFSVSRGF